MSQPASSGRAPDGAQTHDLRILAILSMLMAFASISTDLYLPALPTMARSLHASTGAMEYTISAYLVGFSFGQLVWGPLGDRYGRRTPVSIGLVLFVLGSAGCALAQSPASMIAWRAVQAAGACASVVLARAMVRDLYSGNKAAQMMSTLMTVMAIAPLLGPSVGGIILHFANWRAIFWTLVAVGLVTLAAQRTMPETLPPARRNHEPLSHAFANYARLLRNRRLLGYAGASGFFYGAVYAYIAGTPFAFITYHHVPPQLYGVLFGAGILGIMVTNQINARLVLLYGSDRLMRWGTLAAALSGLVLAVDARTDWGGLIGLFVPLFTFISVAGFIVANSIAGALGCAPERAGAVSALIGSVQYGTGILGSALVGVLADGTPWPMAYVMTLMGLACAASALLLVPVTPAARPETVQRAS
ncbi:multidrug effflux MFS transporter [Paraburkholderia bannensis]|uniref:multidrug effflux MFS transporter n=1 Tax=Paraburkholderia bannensis TaxID=765414 RepID=UPI002ABDFFB4|nr:multidrug effflux MFS transporter [Paraburkholderia bannensis]